MIPGSTLVYALYGALEPMGFHGLVIGSGAGEADTCWDLLLNFPTTYVWCDEGDDIAWWMDRTRVLHQVLGEEFSQEPEVGQQIPLILGTHVAPPLSEFGRRVTGTTFRERSGIEIELGTSPLAAFHDTARLTENGKEPMPFGEPLVAAAVIADRIAEGRLRGEVLTWSRGDEPFWLAEYSLGPAFTRGTYWVRQRLAALLAHNVVLDRLTRGAQAKMREHLIRIHQPEDDVTDEQIADSYEFVSRMVRDHYLLKVAPELVVASMRWRRPEFSGRASEPGADEMIEEVPERSLAVGTPILPSPRLVKGAAAAEEYAAEVMRALGFTDARTTTGGADGGIDVESATGVAQVKMEGLPTGRPALQALVGAATVEGKMPVFFSLAGYTDQALQWAERSGMACFEFAFDGSLEGRTVLARELLLGGVEGWDDVWTAPGRTRLSHPAEPHNDDERYP